MYVRGGHGEAQNGVLSTFRVRYVGDSVEACVAIRDIVSTFIIPSPAIYNH